MRESQFTDEYIQLNHQLGLGKGLTIGTFLAARLRGRARQFGDVYARSLERALLRRGCFPYKSVGGGVAFYLWKEGEEC